MILLLLVLLTMLASLFVTGRVRAYALHNDVVDRPNERSSHDAPTPRGGGVAIVLTALLALVSGQQLGLIAWQEVAALAPGMIVIALVGFVDDHGGLSAPTRLAAHFLAAASCLAVLGGLGAIQLGEFTAVLGIAGSLLGAVGIVWSVNLFNFMDGIDGIAGSQAVLLFVIAAALFLIRGDASLGCVSLVFAAATAGFLYWNWPPARIFMGDAGSGALGFMIAALAIAGERHHSVPFVALLLLYGVFVADATVTLARRLARGKSPVDAHRDHAYQRLARAWGAHRPVTLAACGITIMLGLLAAVATLRPAWALPALLVGALLLGAALVAAERRAPM